MYAIRLPIFSAIVQNSSWPMQGIVYHYQRRVHEQTIGPRIVTIEMYKSYLVLGGLNSIISLCRMIGLTSLPPTLYVITANTEILFEAILTRFYLHRKVSSMQLMAVFFVVAGVTVSLYHHTVTPDSHPLESSKKHHLWSLYLGVAVSIFSRFASSLNTVLADKYVKPHFNFSHFLPFPPRYCYVIHILYNNIMLYNRIITLGSCVFTGYWATIERPTWVS
jgi:drug/metabolite transporter (DMT)-like permease